MGCVCHISALCGAAALKKLPVSSNMLIDVYYHFKHSSKRCEEFKIVLKDFDAWDIASVRVVKALLNQVVKSSASCNPITAAMASVNSCNLCHIFVVVIHIVFLFSHTYIFTYISMINFSIASRY